MSSEMLALPFPDDRPGFFFEVETTFSQTMAHFFKRSSSSPGFSSLLKRSSSSLGFGKFFNRSASVHTDLSLGEDAGATGARPHPRNPGQSLIVAEAKMFKNGELSLWIE